MKAKLAWGLIGLCLLCGCGKGDGSPEARDVTFKFPVLYVVNDDRGAVEMLEMAVKRSPTSDAPLVLALAEDTPGGTSETFRSSAWLAMMVAALTRNDDLAGTSVSITTKGSVDGPSAGAVMCLAVMSALDGKTLPSDFAFTGTIMPDGTIGRVGGVPLKMRAASENGLKRILVPAFARFDDDPHTGKPVDLKALAESLHLTFVPVESIEQAYAAIHGIPQEDHGINEADVLSLPRAVESYAQAVYRKELDAGDDIFKDLPAETKQMIAGDIYFEKPRARAESAMRSGKFLYASDSATAWHRRMQVAQREGQEFSRNKFKDLDDLSRRVDPQIAAILKSAPTPMSLAELCTQNTDPVGSQFCVGLNITTSTRSVLDACDLKHLTRRHEIAVQLAQNPRADTSKLYWRAAGIKLYSYETALELKCGERQLIDFGWCSLLPQTSVLRPRASQTERLFYAAYSASQEAFLASTVGAQATALHVEPAECLALMCQLDDMNLAWCLPIKGIADNLHERIQSPESDKARKVLTALATQFDACGLASISANNVRWTELDTTWPDPDAGKDDLTYARTDFLSSMIARARAVSLRNIAECKRSGIACIQPIALFEAADFCRDDQGTDKVWILGNYWQASLQAKALTMLFQKQK